MTPEPKWSVPTANTEAPADLASDGLGSNDDLFAPPPEQPTKAAPVPTQNASPPPTFEQALANGTIPTFDEQPDDRVPLAPGGPIDPEAEKAAFLAFIALVSAHKAPGTVVTAIDPDRFLDGLV